MLQWVKDSGIAHDFVNHNTLAHIFWSKSKWETLILVFWFRKWLIPQLQLVTNYRLHWNSEQIINPCFWEEIIYKVWKIKQLCMCEGYSNKPQTDSKLFVGIGDFIELRIQSKIPSICQSFIESPINKYRLNRAYHKWILPKHQIILHIKNRMVNVKIIEQAIFKIHIWVGIKNKEFKLRMLLFLWVNKISIWHSIWISITRTTMISHIYIHIYSYLQMIC